MDLSNPACLHSASHSEMPHGEWERRASTSLPLTVPTPTFHRFWQDADTTFAPNSLLTSWAQIHISFCSSMTENLGQDILDGRRCFKQHPQIWVVILYSQTEERPLPSRKACQRYSCGFSRVSGPCCMQSASLPHIQDCCFAMDRPVADV